MCTRGSWDLGGGAKALPQLQEMFNNTPLISSSDPLNVSDGAGKITRNSSCCYSVCSRHDKHHRIKCDDVCLAAQTLVRAGRSFQRNAGAAL